MLIDNASVVQFVNSLSNFEYNRLVAVPRAKATVLHVEKFDGNSRLLHFQNRFKKVVFFMLREGLGVTLRKIWSFRKNRALENDFVFVIVMLENGWIASGFQHSLNQDFYYFLPTAFEKVSGKLNALDDHRNINPFVHAPAETPTPEQQIIADQYSYHPIEFGTPKSGNYNLFMIGCGDYPRTQVIPLFTDFTKFVAIDFNSTVLNYEDIQHFSLRSTDFRSVRKISVGSAKLNLAIITSYHSYHTQQAVEFLKIVPNSVVIIEKPPCVTEDDLHLLSAAYDQKRIFVSYNRRFIPWNIRIKELIRESKGPFIIQIMINEVQISKTHWYYAPNQGTRVTGNLCHWIDLAIFLLGKKPVKLTIAKNPIGIDNSVFTILFEDGSTVSMIATEYGDGTYGVRESLTVKGPELDISVDDYTNMKVWNQGKTETFSSLTRDKGHRRMYQTFKKRIVQGKVSEYTKEELVYSTAAYIQFVKLYRSEESTCVVDVDKFLDKVAPTVTEIH